MGDSADSNSAVLVNKASATRHSKNGYVEYRPSTCWPVVISAPHGGELEPATIADRSTGCVEPDWFSVELAEAISDSFCALPGSPGPPSLVMLKLSRKKLDANRARKPSCEDGGVGEAGEAWDAYHGWLEEALRDCVKRFGFCLLLDVHGQSHRRDVTELGYLLTSDDLLLDDAVIDATVSRASSIDAFVSNKPISAADTTGAQTLRPGLAALVRGEHSLGGLMGRRGFRCTPSPEIPQPVSAEVLREAKKRKADVAAVAGPPPPETAAATYFWGGYSAKRYGASTTVPAEFNPLSCEACCAWAKDVAAVQMETSWIHVREDACARARFAEALRDSVSEFLATWRKWVPENRDARTP